MHRSVAIIGEYSPTSETHTATQATILHSCAALGLQVSSTWISTAELGESVFHHHQGRRMSKSIPAWLMMRSLHSFGT
jgi:CTP synthase (UTP-ammonia lyase)